MREDHYAVLGVSPDASEQEIKRAYRRLAVRFHPDQRPSRIADMLMRRLNEAYEVLSDADKRRTYDAELERARAAAAKKKRPAKKKRAAKKKRRYEEDPGELERRVGRALSAYAHERDRVVRRVDAVDDNAEHMRLLADEQETQEQLATRERDLQQRRWRTFLWVALLAAVVVLLLRLSG
jgi:curved DNA-binding protein CbpA